MKICVFDECAPNRSSRPLNTQLPLEISIRIQWKTSRVPPPPSQIEQTWKILHSYPLKGAAMYIYIFPYMFPTSFASAPKAPSGMGLHWGDHLGTIWGPSGKWIRWSYRFHYGSGPSGVRGSIRLVFRSTDAQNLRKVVVGKNQISKKSWTNIKNGQNGHSIKIPYKNPL